MPGTSCSSAISTRSIVSSRTRPRRTPLISVQRTFLALLEALERFRQESSFRTFLFAIAHHELMAHWRSRSRVELKSSLSSVLDLDPSPSALITRVAEERHLLEALRSIPIELQVALELFYSEGLTGPELAVVLSVPEGTARSRLRRGLELLRQRLDHLEHGPERLGSTLASLDGWARAIGRGPPRAARRLSGSARNANGADVDHPASY